MVFLLGNGANGKSVLANLLRRSLGSYAVSMSPDFLVQSQRDGEGATPALASLPGARLALANEVEAGARLSAKTVKVACSTEAVAARQGKRAAASANGCTSGCGCAMTSRAGPRCETSCCESFADERAAVCRFESSRLPAAQDAQDLGHFPASPYGEKCRESYPKQPQILFILCAAGAVVQVRAHRLSINRGRKR